MSKRITDFMAWLGGADTEILRRVPTEQARFVQMGGVLLTTASIALLSMIFALHDGMKISLLPSLLLGLFWGVIILNLDRFLVLSMGTTRRIWHLALMALPRLLLASVLALVISTPLVLRIFASDINSQLYTMQLQNSQQQGQLEAHTKEQKQLNQANAKISQDNAILRGQVPGATSPQLQFDQSQVTKLQSQKAKAFNTMNADYRTWQCELQGQNGAGCNGVSGKSGNGPRSQADQQAYEQAKAAYDTAASQLQQAQSAEKQDQAAANKNDAGVVARAQQQASQDLVTQTSLRNRLQTEIDAESAAGSHANQANTGILAQLQALSDASARSPSLNAARLAVLALFFLIEILPVTVKILLNLAPNESEYDKIAEAESLARIAAAQAEAQAQVKIAELESQAPVKEAQTQDNVGDDMRTRKEALGRTANAHVADEMERVLKAELRNWSSQVRARLAAYGEANDSVLSANGSPHQESSENSGLGLPNGSEL